MSGGAGDDRIEPDVEVDYGADAIRIRREH